MALSGDEVFGTKVPGFVTDTDGRLVVTTAPDEIVEGEHVAGFVTDTDGRLVIGNGS